MWKIQFICIVFLVVVSQIKADEIKLKNGEIIIGQIESEDETKITVLSGTGEKQDIKRGDIDEINYTPGGRIRLEKPSPATTAEPVQAILDNQVKPLPEWLDGDYRIQTKDGLVISRGRIISETDRIYWVAPYASDGDAYMVAIQKDRLLAPPQKLSSPPQKLLTSSPPPRARDGQPLMQNQDFWSGGRLSLQQSYMRDYSWYKSSRGAASLQSAHTSPMSIA
jgi:hypothetical protein